MQEKFTREELLSVLDAAGIGGVTDVSRYGSGHINITFKVETSGGKRYILQRVQHRYFRRSAFEAQRDARDGIPEKEGRQVAQRRGI